VFRAGKAMTAAQLQDHYPMPPKGVTNPPFIPVRSLGVKLWRSQHRNRRTAPDRPSGQRNPLQGYGHRRAGV